MSEQKPPAVPLSDRPGYEEIRYSPLAKSVRKLREKHGLVGCVLIDFTSERVGVCAAGVTEEFKGHMQVLGDRILAAIDAGQFDPEAS